VAGAIVGKIIKKNQRTKYLTIAEWKMAFTDFSLRLFSVIRGQLDGNSVCRFRLKAFFGNFLVSFTDFSLRLISVSGSASALQLSPDCCL